MPANYAAFLTVTNDQQYAKKINDFMTQVQTDMNLKMDSSGVLTRPISVVSGNYTVLTTDYTIEINANVANVTLTLPSAAANTGRTYIFRKTDATAYLAIIDTFYTLYIQGESVTFESNGTTWVRIA
jgi:hypothetical protein